MLKDIVDGLKLVVEGIGSVKEIAEAVRTGKEYLSTNHPEVREDLCLMLEELNKSQQLIKRSSAILTNFRFAVAAGGEAVELARFNDYYIQSKGEASHLELNIDDLRTHCSKIRRHGGEICDGTGVDAFSRFFGFLGLNSPERERKLGEMLDKLAYEDFAAANSAENMLKCLKAALGDVQDTLCDNAVMDAGNIPKAAALLTEYGEEFEVTEELADKAVRVIRGLVKELDLHAVVPA